MNNPDPLFAGLGEMHARCRQTDWSATLLGQSGGLARGMRGALAVESDLGVGSAFTLTLPRTHEDT